MEIIVQKLNEIQQIKDKLGFISVAVDQFGPSIHLTRKDFLALKKEFNWQTETELWHNGRVEEKTIIEGVRVFSLLDKNEYKVDFRFTGKND